MYEFEVSGAPPTYCASVSMISGSVNRMPGRPLV